jgi:DNA-binding NtrC family response regulator
MPTTVLIADDDPIQRRLLTEMVKRAGYDPVTVDSGEAALERIQKGEPQIDLLILDLVMPDLDGMGVLGKLREKSIVLPVIVQTAHGSIETVISAMRAGAADFVVKPVGAERLNISIKNALKVDALEGELRRVNRRVSNMMTFNDLVTRSPDMERVIRLGERSAKSAIPVLLEGESGVGKEVVARAIQGCSDRRGKPFVTVNCGAIPSNLVESILFGHEKGSFTGAMDRHVGKFAEANHGTLFLDEIGELPLDAQVKLLRAIQESEIDPVGGKKSIKVDIRIISATNQNLIELVKQGRFREDLFYRLNVFPISIPPLRNRRDDIPDLARRFLARFAAEEGRAIRAISSEALALIIKYDWPGNVRQLENAIFRAVVLCEGDELTVAEFPQIATQVDGFELRIPMAPVLTAGLPMQTRTVREIIQVPVTDPNAMKLVDETGDMRKLEEIERETIKFAINHYRGQMSKVARKLSIGRSTLYRKLKELGLEEAIQSEMSDESSRDNIWAGKDDQAA